MLSFYSRPMASPILVDRMGEIQHKRKTSSKSNLSMYLKSSLFSSIDQSRFNENRKNISRAKSIITVSSQNCRQSNSSFMTEKIIENQLLYLSQRIDWRRFNENITRLSFISSKESQNENIFHYRSSFIQGETRKVFSSILTEDISIAVLIYFSQTPLHHDQCTFAFEKTNHRNSVLINETRN